ncbi:MAG: cation-translocating P-type ATPase [Chloroflexi bacterium]|nr:cation-translocating P-type ATPase [Chloroflexota bacterium]
MSNWYQLDPEKVLQELKTNAETGLSDAEVQQRLVQYGHNELIEKGIKSPWRILLEQIAEPMVLILIAAAVISIILGEYVDSVVILLIVILNAAIGVSQEYRAEQAIAALKKLAVPTVKVRRGGHPVTVSSRELVPGDIVRLEAGDFAPADGRLIESANLRIEEAALTGESEPVEKKIITLHGDDLTIGDRYNMVHMGTVVTYGRGTLVITETGMNTQLGHIANLLQGVERDPTPLQRRLEQLTKTLAVVSLVIIAIVIALGILRTTGAIDWGELILTGISMAVAAVPEGLPAVVTITLALGAQRMLKRHALIRKLPAVETLGSVTVICSDKTGTLTENRMTVTVLDVANEKQTIENLIASRQPVVHAEVDASLPPPTRTLGLLLKAMVLANDTELEIEEGTNQIRAVGDPTEAALVVAAAQLGLNKTNLEKRWPRVAEVPFTSTRKRMTTIHKAAIETGQSDSPWHSDPYVAFCKGAVDGLLEICDTVWYGDGGVPLDSEMRGRILQGNQELAAQGQRILGVAFRSLQAIPDTTNEAETESHLTFIGLVGMLDPARPEVKPAVATAKGAGIRPMMITGDHPLTAQNIAQELQIVSRDDHKNLTGQDLAKMSVQELEKTVAEVSVYARVAPEHKLNIVQALQAQGHIVAMTGDGVNDAPALKKADIGVAMGITGTDVSKEAADMILLDDNFATIVAAIEEGRVIYDNIRKFIRYTLSSNFGELFVMFVGPLFGMPLPLLPLQILWINLVTDGVPGLALAIEPGERNIMKRKPFHPKENILGRGLGMMIIWVGGLMGLVSLIPGYLLWRENPTFAHEEATVWQTMIFTTLTLAQMGNALAIRSDYDSLFKIGIFSNRPMVAAVVLTFVLQMALIYVPFLQNVFNTVALTLGQLGICLALSTIVFIAIEIQKWFKRRSAAA